MPRTGVARLLSFAGPSALAILAAAPVRGDLLPNEVPGEIGLSVAARIAAGPHVKPLAPAVLDVTIQNPGEPFHGLIRIERVSGDGIASFGPSSPVRLERGATSLEIVFVPGGAASAPRLGVSAAPGGVSPESGAKAAAGRAVFRGDLSRVIRPLDSGERLVLAVGLRAFPLPAGEFEGCRLVVSALEPRELPTRDEAYAAVDLAIVEEAGRASVSAAQAEALARYLLGGGRLIFASFRALGAFERALFGAGPAPRTWADWPGGASSSLREEGLPERLEIPFGLGRLVVFAAEPADSAAWRAPTGPVVSRLLAGRPPRQGSDRGSFEALVPARPFQSAASRGRTAAIIGGLLAGAVAPFLFRARRRLALGALAAAAIAWAAAVTILWGASAGAARLVRVRLFTADGRAEILTDTAVLVPLGAQTLGLECGTGPPLPIRRRSGEGDAFVLLEDGPVWRASLPAGRAGEARLLAARSVRSRIRAGGDADSELVTRVLSRGPRARLVGLPGRALRCETLSDELPADLRRLIECAVPEAGDVAWAWEAGVPEGVRAPGLDPAPGSGTLVIAQVPPGEVRYSPISGERPTAP